jgi:hypothetical protein
MNQRSSSKMSLFLMELIVAIMFFSLSAAVCVRLFSSAHIMADSTENLSNAIIWSQNLSETFVGSKGDLSAIAELYPSGYVTYDPADHSLRDGSIILFFNEDWELTNDDLSEASYEAIMTTSTENASDVYADVTDYNVALEGTAAVGVIAVLDLRGAEDVLSEIPESNEKVILKNNVDTFIGKEVG